MAGLVLRHAFGLAQSVAGNAQRQDFSRCDGQFWRLCFDGQLRLARGGRRPLGFGLAALSQHLCGRTGQQTQAQNGKRSPHGVFPLRWLV
jgi:hypothetical protein